MRLALKELRRRPARFATAAVILSLIAALLMFLGGLLDGLIAASTGAIRAQDVDAIVYSDTAQAGGTGFGVSTLVRFALQRFGINAGRISALCQIFVDQK